ncbi:MAG: hypothetical protein ACLQBA_18205 [Candidatus Binataceae bacterium]
MIATDRQVTHGAMGTTTIGQAGTKAAVIRNGQALYASSGAIGLGQQICAGIEGIDIKFHNHGCIAALQAIQKAARVVIAPAFEIAAKSVAVLGHPATQQDAVCTGLLAAKFSDGIKLVELNAQGGCEMLTLESVPFICQGSGKANADPFLRFLWDVYWSKSAPMLKEAVLAGYWTVKVVTQLRTSGVGCGVEVFTLRHSSNAAIAEKIADSALDEHNEFIAAVEEGMRGVRDRMLGKPGGPPTSAPPVLNEASKQG